MNTSRRVMLGRFFGLLLLVVSIFEFRGAFTGPLAFLRKPTLILSPLYAPSLDEDQISEVRLLVEKELAAGGDHALYPQSLIENFYLERDNAVGVFDGSYRGKDEAFELAEALGVERVAVASILQYSGEPKLRLTLYDVATDQQVSYISLAFTDYQGLLDWIDTEGNAVDFSESVGATVPGLSVGAWLFLAWLAGAGVVALILLIGAALPRFIPEFLLAVGLLLGFFSWIYALNGDMDYVQRFVATSGSLDIADTAAERQATLWRYALPFLLLAAVWFMDAAERISSRLEAGGGGIPSAMVDIFAPLGAGLAAFLYTLALPNFLRLEGFPALAWIATAPLYLVLRKVRLGRGVGLVFFFMGLQALLVNWWQGTFSYVSLPFTVTLTLVQAAPFALLLVFTVGKWPRTGYWAAPLLWTLFDWYRSLGFLGYPWAILGVSQYNHPGLIQMASLGGVWMVSLLVHFGGAALARALDGLISGEGAWRLRSRSVVEPAMASLPGRRFSLPHFAAKPWFPVLIIALIGLGAAGGGRLVIRARDIAGIEAETAGETRSVSLLFVQQNTDPRKHDYHLSFQELSRLTEEAVEARAAAGKAPFDLVAWPESGFVPDIRFWLQPKKATWKRGKLVRSFLDWQADLGVPLVTGTQDHFYEPAPPSDDPEAPLEVKRIQNSAMYLPAGRTSDSDRDYYYKIRLVPFTENFPYGEQFPWVAEMLHNFSTTQWTPGTERKLLHAPAFSFATPICFEDVFPNHVRHFVLNGAQVLVNMSNDYWANTPLEGYQHGAHAIFRAVENRCPLVRATCSGWTIAVDPEGRIAEDWPEFYTPAWAEADFSLSAEGSLSVYTRLGDWLPVLCGILWILLGVGEFVFRRRDTYGASVLPAG